MTIRHNSTPAGIPLIYADAIGNRGGTGVYVRRLLRGMSQIDSETAVAIGGSLGTPGSALETVPLTGIARVLEESLRLPFRLKRNLPSLVHLPAFSGRSPVDVPVAVTLHDLAFFRDPSWFPRMKSIYYRLHFTRVSRRADVVMVDSDFTAMEASLLLGLEPERIRRIYLSTDSFRSDPLLFREFSGIRDEYLLFAGTVEPRKNLSALLDALPRIIGEHPEFKLVVAGRWGWGGDLLQRRLLETDGVIWVGSLPLDVLRSCIAGARLLIYPSLYEGFGLPPLEAASAGVPSVISPASALVEIYGDVAFVSKGFDPISISTAVLEAINTQSDEDGLVSFAESFSIGRMTEEVLRVYGEFRR